MQKIKLILLMTGICVHSFFVQAERPTSNLPTKQESPSIFHTIDSVYRKIDFKGADQLNIEVFTQAYIGYLNLWEAGLIPKDKQLLSICDFSLSSNTKRLWVIDMRSKSVLFHSLVAHGQGTGEEFAKKFSDRENSHQSSLGFYLTDDTYVGRNGYSLRLHGKDKGYNANAFNRAIVMHGADYVSPQFIKGNKRLGRSWGCPAVPQKLAKPIIDTIKGGSVLFVYYPSKAYRTASTWLAQIPASLQTQSQPHVISPHEPLKQTWALAEAIDEQGENQSHLNPPGVNNPELKSPVMYKEVQLATPADH